jgi:hypothetical protein
MCLHGVKYLNIMAANACYRCILRTKSEFWRYKYIRNIRLKIIAIADAIELGLFIHYHILQALAIRLDFGR